MGVKQGCGEDGVGEAGLYLSELAFLDLVLVGLGKGGTSINWKSVPRAGILFFLARWLGMLQPGSFWTCSSPIFFFVATFLIIKIK